VRTRTEAKISEYACFGVVEKVKNVNFDFSEWTQPIQNAIQSQSHSVRNLYRHYKWASCLDFFSRKSLLT